MRAHVPVACALAAVLGFALSLALVLNGCGGGEVGGAAGSVSLAITDAPGVFAEVHLAIREVRLVPAGEGEAPTGGGLPLLASYDPPREVDVLNLAFQQELLGEATVPAGTYEQLRLVLAPNVAGQPPANYVTLETDPLAQIPLTTPSAQRSGLKVLGRFEVAPGTATALVLDFDPSRAIVQAGKSGKYNLKPTSIRLTRVDSILANYGGLVLTVDPAEARATALVAVFPEGGASPVAVGTVDPDTGYFRAALPAGTYTFRVSATGYQAYDTALLLPPATYAVSVGADTVLIDPVTLVPPP